MPADDDSLRAWTLGLQRQVMTTTSWMGVQMCKSPLDAWIYQEILHEVRPDVVIEIGSYRGGSTLFFAHILDLLGAGRVISIDVDRTAWSVSHDRITRLDGSSSDPEVQRQVGELCDGRSVLVCHDGDHRAEQVLRDLHDYAKWVTVGSYYIVEDGIVDLFPVGSAIHPATIDDGPLPAIESFLESDSRFVVDEHRERFGVTWNPRGYLRRVS